MVLVLALITTLEAFLLVVLSNFVAFANFNSQNEAFIRGGSNGNITQADQGLFYAFGGAAAAAAVEGAQLQVVFELVRVV